MSNEAQNILDRVLGGLGYKKSVAIQMSQKKTADGETIFDSENFAIGDSVFIVTADGNIPVPSGDYELEDGSVVSVDESGIISAIGTKTPESAEMESSPVVEQPAPMTPKTIIESMTKETQFAETPVMDNPAIEEKIEEQTMGKPALLVKCEDMVGPENAPLAEKIAEAIVSIVDNGDAEELISEYKKAKNKTKMSAHSPEIAETLRAFELKLNALSQENEALKEALSTEGNRTFFNPEQNSKTKINFKIGAQREETITDRVFSQLFS
jgi:hypothetical protein